MAGEWYQVNGDKINLARRYLVEEEGVAPDVVEAVDRGALLEFFQQTVGVDAWQTREILWNTYEPYGMWSLFMMIGLGSMLAIVIYNVVTQKADREPEFSFNTKGHVWVRIALVPIVAIFLYAAVVEPSISVITMAIMFALLFAASFVPEKTAPRV